MHIQISKQIPILPWHYKWSMGHQTKEYEVDEIGP